MTVSITVSADVIDRVGLQEAADFQASITTFECVECGTAGDTMAEPAVVVLRKSPGLSHLGVAHHRCASSQVREYGPGDLVLADELDLIPRAIALPSADGLRPALLLACEEKITVDGQDFVLKVLLAEGLHRVAALGKKAPHSPGWEVTAGPDTAVQVSSSHRTYLNSGEMYAPPAWRTLAAAVGEVVLIMGRLDRSVLHAEGAPLAAYGRAMKAGHLVAGTVPVILR
ncbi:hypothetical protein [Streptomyces sp. NPDC055036]